MFNLTSRTYILISVGIVALQIFALNLFGQPAYCTCGYIKLWEGVVLSIGNSQHLTDWYTFSHIIHGIIFFYAITAVFPRSPVLLRLLLSVGLESGWEIIENTPWAINHYRMQALAQGYTGDSILNSFSDSLSMIIGFVLAWRLPLYVVAGLAIFLELLVGYLIHDGLLLNVINLIYPFQFIADWQSGS